MTYLALYRKWRPKTFSEVVGQEHITKTLENALNSGRIGHAYLFCGPRGTGKTSTAKILAQAVNCEHGVSAVPCGECSRCRDIRAGNSVDVLEIDAASNRGIDEIRALRDKVKYSPAESRYKVYIIDEVHMLTPEAFNALLKTLEEPPQSVIFILATTEPHKLLPTILSRCQRYDFRRIAVHDIRERLKSLCAAENVQVDDQSLTEIAERADGSQRDAESILDQCLAFGGDKLTIEDVHLVLGTVSLDFLYRLVEAIRTHDVKETITLVEEVVGSGLDLQQFIKDLLKYLRDLLILETVDQEMDLLERSVEIRKKMNSQAARVNRDKILYIVDVVSDTLVQMKRTGIPRVPLELAMIGLASGMTPKAPDMGSVREQLDALFDRVSELEKMVKGHIPSVMEKESMAAEPQTETAKSAPEKKTRRDAPASQGNLKKELLAKIRKKKDMLLYSMLTGAQLHVAGNKVRMLVDRDIYRERLAEPENSALIAQYLSAITGKKLTVEVLSTKQREKKKDTLSATEIKKKDLETTENDDNGQTGVNELLTLFGGEVIDLDADDKN